MDFNEIKREVRNIRFDTLRSDQDDYFEAVLVKEELEKLKDRLKKLLGEPVFPSPDKLSSRIEETIQDFGGVRRDQTLYLKEDGQDTIFAMLWPWQDGLHTTLKIVQKK